MDGAMEWFLFWSASFLLLFQGFTSAQQTFGYVSPTFSWPLAIDTQGIDLVKGSIGRLHNITKVNDGPAGLGYNATQFNSVLKSYTQLHVDDNARAELESAYAFQLYIKPEGDGVFLHYESLDQAPYQGSINSLKARIIDGSIAVELSNGKTTEKQVLNLGIAYNQWHQVAIGRDATTNHCMVVVDGFEYKLAFGPWVGGAITKGAGQVRVGGSMDEESFISARIACLQLIGCDNPLGGSKYDDQCSSGWPNPLPWDVPLRPATTYKPLNVGYNPCYG